MRRHYEDKEIDLTEGVKVFFDEDAWLHARPSNTEPIVRVIAEADHSRAARELCDEGMKIVEEAIG